MAYTSSKASAGLGTLSINTGTVATPVWTPFAEITKISTSGFGAGKDEVTNANSIKTEYLPTIPSAGSWTVDGNYVIGDPGYAAAVAGILSPSLSQFQYVDVLKNGETTKGETSTFFAVIEALDKQSYEKKKALTYQMKLAVSGDITVTPGS